MKTLLMRRTMTLKMTALTAMLEVVSNYKEGRQARMTLGELVRAGSRLLRRTSAEGLTQATMTARKMMSPM